MVIVRGHAVVVGVALAGVAHAQPADDAANPPKRWSDGDHLTGEWGGARTALADRGVTIDLVYSAELFAAHDDSRALGHVDAALTLDSHKLGLWDGATLYVLVHNNHGHGINEIVGAAAPVSNLEPAPYTQLAELFLEQALFDDRLRIRIGKQDANRDFGTPRFSGNFINGNFGMYPNVPLPSYPATGLGAVVIARPVDWLTGRVAIYEGSPEFGGVGLTTAFQAGAGYVAVASAAVDHHFGPHARDGGTTSVGAWRSSTDALEVGVDMPRTFDSDAGWFVQNDERIYLHPDDAHDQRGINVIVRASAARADRTLVSRYAGGSVAWHGLGSRDNDTVGAGGGYLHIMDPLGGSPAPADEWFIEAFYKLRLTSFVSAQPDLQWYRHPGGDGRDALIGGVRIKLKL